jgi:PTS system ascorbate-specific IIB component
MLKVIAACGNGMGTSQIIKMKISGVFKRLGVAADVAHMSVGEAKSQASAYDVVFCTDALTANFKVGPKTRVIGLRNLLSEKEIEEKLRAAGVV